MRLDCVSDAPNHPHERLVVDLSVQARVRLLQGVQLLFPRLDLDALGKVDGVVYCAGVAVLGVGYERHVCARRP